MESPMHGLKNQIEYFVHALYMVLRHTKFICHALYPHNWGFFQERIC